jgi:hypothetical protein
MTIEEALAHVAANVADLEVDEIKRILDPFRDGMKVISPFFNAGTFIYRGRRLDHTFTKEKCLKTADLSYPPTGGVQFGRLNRPGEPKFYGSMGKEVVFYELLGLSPGDELVLGFWKTKELMYVNNIGYTEFVFQKLGASRLCPSWEPTESSDRQKFELPRRSQAEISKILSQQENDTLRELFSTYFGESIETHQNHKYKISTAIGELHLGKLATGGEFAGVLYPSIRMWANGDNIALLPFFIDNHLEFRKAMHIRIDDRSEKSFSITTLDCARIGEDGCLHWHGGVPPIWVGPAAAGETLEFVFASAPDDDGDYIISAQGNPGHWVLNERRTQETLERPSGDLTRSQNERLARTSP